MSKSKREQRLSELLESAEFESEEDKEEFKRTLEAYHNELVETTTSMGKVECATQLAEIVNQDLRDMIMLKPSIDSGVVDLKRTLTDAYTGLTRKLNAKFREIVEEAKTITQKYNE